MLFATKFSKLSFPYTLGITLYEPSVFLTIDTTVLSPVSLASNTATTLLSGSVLYLSFLHAGPAQTFVCVGAVQAGTRTLNPYLKTPLKICVPHAQIMYGT